MEMSKATIIYGAPGSGKTTYVLKRMRRGDVVIDFDLIFSAISGREPHDKPANLLKLAWDIRDDVYKRVMEHREEVGKIWIIIGGAKRSDRNTIASWFNADLHHVEATPNECYARMRDDKTRPGGWQASKGVVDKWFMQYEK